MANRVASLLACLALAQSLDAAEPYLFGPLGPRLPAADIGAIKVVVGEDARPWALLGWSSQVLPKVLYVDAFLPPILSTGRLRRGKVLHLECAPGAEDAACSHWKITGSADAYAQVADGADGFGETLVPRTRLEWPMQLSGEFADSDLLSLVSFIRTSPRPPAPDGWVGSAGLSGSVPIRHLQLEPDGSVKVWLTFQEGLGQSATLVRTQHGWQVTEVWSGVA